jgi:hypothetical protein
LPQFFPDDTSIFALDDVESPGVIASMNEEERHRARIRLMRTFPGAAVVIGEMFLASPEAVGPGNNLLARRERAERHAAERSFEVTYQDRLFLYNELYRRTKFVYPEVDRRSVAHARRRLQNRSLRSLRSRATVTPPSEMPNFVIIPLYIHPFLLFIVQLILLASEPYAFTNISIFIFSNNSK